MKFFTLTLLACVLSVGTNAQDENLKKIKAETARSVAGQDFDTSLTHWNKGGMFNLAIAQASLKNWAAGGDEFSLTVNSIVNYFVQYRKGKIAWDNNLDLNFGYMQTTTLGGLKNDDRLDVLSKLGYNIGKNIFASALLTVRSQMFDGHNDEQLNSTFLSPAYVVGSLGFDVKPLPKLSVFMSPLASRMVYINNAKVAALGLYGVPKNEKLVSQFGAFLTANYNSSIAKGINYKMRFDAFSNYKHNPQNVDIFMANVFSFKVNKYISATYNIDFIYDDDIALFGKEQNAPALQVKSLIGIGLQVPLNKK